MSETRMDILIAGGSTGGCTAAMAVTSTGCRIALTEVADWIGGQGTELAWPRTSLV